MDDSLERPSTLTSPGSADLRDQDDENSSGDEDGALDWSKLPPAPGRPVIPKRGEKDFEPSVEGGSGLQLHVLDRARAAMLEALKADRNTSSKSISYGIWYPSISRAHATVARGVHFGSMGHSVPRPAPSNAGEGSKIQKRLELLPEEALYLVERGTLFCTRESPTVKLNAPGMEDIEGAPMTVQQAFAEMIGSEGLTLEKYQVYAYLKRLGFSITRTDPPTSSYPSAQPFASVTPPTSLLQRLFSWIPSCMARIRQLFSRRFDWWKPLRIGGFFHHNQNMNSVFKSLRFIPSGHSVALQPSKNLAAQASPYKIFYNLYKPSTPFRKTAPGPPDFSLVIINARTTPMPSLHELAALFDVLPEMPPPPPRQRRPLPGDKTPAPAATPKQANELATTAQPGFTLSTLFPWAFNNKEPSQPPPQVRRPNPFVVLKSGKKSVVVAAVDTGSISFFRFGQGAFEEFPVV
ncbi:hypothetical protein FIBSPDRAFT_930627 [Athelia psychrophila]|uniref:tRNA-splicing endonuclease subunit Sen54 N-terminal domain-containing protein n=1 Tax=Athelia psychrophila TaxID=1759441 RepID=A0A166LTK9_9AGAM|nr:hypothetical protein FIBSPDRAFT_930627 [Fibularhizoctonia sp. CBS 109695]